ncbi:LINE-1 retrotransposable element ORF2 protein [Linum perenne]
MTRSCSDHHPLVLTCQDGTRIRRPWKFEDMWFEHACFKEFVIHAWSLPVEGFGDIFRLTKKLKQLKLNLIEWNNSVFRRTDVQIQDILAKIDRLDNQEEVGRLEEVDRLERMLLKCDLDNLWKMEEVSWIQKSREKWSKFGDRNSAFFHRIANFNKRRNFIDIINVNGITVSGQEALESAFVNFFKDLYSDPRSERPFPNRLSFNKIPQEKATALLDRFSEAEIRSAVHSCANGKAPGPDGFSFGFFKRFWSTIKQDICAAVWEFQANAKLPRTANCTFLVLIPKKEAVGDIRDFRPISLVGGVYKIISKCLLHRLKDNMVSIISRHQCAFVGGRQILDAALIANEVLDSRRRSGKPGLMFKLDLEKAFDHVNWSCLLGVLTRMNFPRRWLKWIRTCISSPSFSILVNGKSSGFFNSTRGLRQGDSLSPFLFIIVMEVLSAILLKVQEAGLIKGFFMNERDGSGQVNHILFADDTLIFCDAEVSQVRYLLASLICFECITGLKINIHKSSMFAVGEVDDAALLAEAFGCELASLPTCYLGLPLGDRVPSCPSWAPIIDRVEKRLSNWKARLLSYGARLVLIKSVLACLPTYQLSLFKVPTRISNTLEKIQRRFLWEGTADQRRIHWVDWSSIKTPLESGGLGILDIKTFNEALLGKWFWRYAVERSAWWRSLIVAKYGAGPSDWCPHSVFRSTGISAWIRIAQSGSNFWRFAFIDPGGGFCSFWRDHWVLGESLSNLYPRIMAADANSSGSRVFDYRTFDRSRWFMPMRFDLRGGALLELQRLQTQLDSLPPLLITEGPDFIVWPGGKEQRFSVSSFRQLLHAERFTGLASFPSESIWLSFVPTKVQFFCWLTYRNRIATTDNLQRRGLALPNRCSLCEKDAESVDHIFIHCHFASQVWYRLSSTLSLNGPLPSSFKGLLLMWKDMNCVSRFSEARKILLHGYIWYIWLERNERIFRDSHRSVQQVFIRIWLAIARWMHAFGKFGDDRQKEWVRLCFDNG